MNKPALNGTHRKITGRDGEEATMNSAAPQAQKDAKTVEKSAVADLAFKEPAVLVNNFNIAFGPTHVRLAAVENAHDGTPFIRAVLACDFATVRTLHDLTGQMLDYLEEQKKRMTELLKNNSVDALGVDANGNKVADAKEAANNTQAKVG